MAARLFSKLGIIGPATFACTSLLFLAVGFDRYFVTPIYAWGDFAANSMRIERAQHFEEGYGNYSRWGFSHPGPAYFYVYAAGETLFHDWLGLCPEEVNAQLLTGMLLQAGFYALALTMVYSHLRCRWTTALLGLAGMLHFLSTRQAFISIWPPHQFLTAYLCLLLSTASILSGSIRWLWVFALSAGFCVHSHVAQPLFVLPLATLVFCSWMRFYGRKRESIDPIESSLTEPLTVQRIKRQQRRDVLLVMSILAPFLLPIVLDLTRLSNSNFAKILRHLRSHQSVDHSWIASLDYYLQFYRYWGFHDTPNPAAGITTLVTYPVIFSLWALATAVAGWLTWRTWRDKSKLEGSRFFRSLGCVLTLVVLLTIYWGKIMDGEMYAFNGFFNYAVISLQGLWILCVCIAEIPVRKIRPVAVILCIGCLWLIAGRVRLLRLPWIEQTDFEPAPLQHLLCTAPYRESQIVYLHDGPRPDDWAMLMACGNHLRKMNRFAAFNARWEYVVESPMVIGKVLQDHPDVPLVCVEVSEAIKTMQGRETLTPTFNILPTMPMPVQASELTLPALVKHSGFVNHLSQDEVGAFAATLTSHSCIVLPISPQSVRPVDYNGWDLRLSLAPNVSPEDRTSISLCLELDQSEIYSGTIQGLTQLTVPLNAELLRRCVQQRHALVIQFHSPASRRAFSDRWELRRTPGFRIYQCSLIQRGNEVKD